MTIIALLGGLVLGGLAFALFEAVARRWARCRSSGITDSESRA
jgi:hypothetical protein